MKWTKVKMKMEIWWEERGKLREGSTSPWFHRIRPPPPLAASSLSMQIMTASIPKFYICTDNKWVVEFMIAENYRNQVDCGQWKPIDRFWSTGLQHTSHHNSLFTSTVCTYILSTLSIGPEDSHTSANFSQLQPPDRGVYTESAELDFHQNRDRSTRISGSRQHSLENNKQCRRIYRIVWKGFAWSVRRYGV